MHSADPAGRDDRDPGAGRDLHRGGDRRRADALPGEDRGEVPQRDLRDARFTREPREQVIPDAHDGPPVVERDRRGDRPEGADLRLEQLCGPQAPRSGKAVRDDRGLECNDGALAGDRVGALWRDGELHESWGVRGGRSPPWVCSPLSPARSSTACGSTGTSTSSDSRTARGDPGRFTTSAGPMAPATPRDSMPCGVCSRERARRASAMPGISRSMTRRVASGVTSFGDRPVPPVVRTTFAPARTAARMAVATRSTSSGTSSVRTTSMPSAVRRFLLAGAPPLPPPPAAPPLRPPALPPPPRPSPPPPP